MYIKEYVKKGKKKIIYLKAKIKKKKGKEKEESNEIQPKK